jgi:hypothetical protein
LPICNRSNGRGGKGKEVRRRGKEVGEEKEEKKGKKGKKKRRGDQRVNNKLERTYRDENPTTSIPPPRAPLLATVVPGKTVDIKRKISRVGPTEREGEGTQ